MHRRRDIRIPFEELGATLVLKADFGNSFDHAMVVEASHSGLSVLFDSPFAPPEGSMHTVRLSIDGAGPAKLVLETYKHHRANLIGFKITAYEENQDLYFSLIDRALQRRKQAYLSAPGSWRVSDNHFKEAIENPWYKVLFRLYSEVYFTTNKFFADRNYVPALMPITVESVSSPMGLGSDSIPVQVSLFGKDIYLADSMQFQLEYMLRHQCEGVFYVMPTFRGEDADSRHLNQFFHAEAEIRGDLPKVMKLIEDYVGELSESILSKLSDSLKPFVAGDLSHLKYLVSQIGKVPQISYSEAEKVLGSDPKFYSLIEGKYRAISSAGEQELMKHFNGCVWLTHPIHELVPFYQAYTADNKFAKAADFLIGIGETVGCGERHVDSDSLTLALKSHRVPPDEYEWYIRMKQDYPMQTAGFGLGIERFLLWVMKHSDIRDMSIISRIKGMKSTP